MSDHVVQRIRIVFKTTGGQRCGRGLVLNFLLDISWCGLWRLPNQMGEKVSDALTLKPEQSGPIPWS